MAKSDDTASCNSLFCCSDLESDLEKSVLTKNLPNFVALLEEVKRTNYKIHRFDRCWELIASEQNMGKFAEGLLEIGANPNHLFAARGCRLIHSVAEYGNYAVLEVIVKHGADVNATNSFGRSALHLATSRYCDCHADQSKRNDYVKCVSVLCSCPDVQVNIADSKGLSAPDIAASRRCFELVRYFGTVGAGRALRQELTGQKCGAEVSDEKKVDADLHMALQAGDLLKFKAVLSNSTAADLQKPRGSFTCLQFACYRGMEDFVRLMLENNANPNGTSEYNGTYPLHYAAEGGFPAIAKWLLDSGANPDCVDKRLDTPLHKVVKKLTASCDRSEDYGRCVRLLLDGNASVNAQDVLGNTPLHYAVLQCAQDVVKLLLKSGASFGMKNIQGDAPIAHMQTGTLKAFFDECIQMNTACNVSSDDLQLSFDYRFLKIPSNSNLASADFPETEYLWYMSLQKRHHILFKHPVITSFLHFKWCKVKKYFFLNCLFFLCFVVLVTAFVLVKYSISQKSSVNSHEYAMKDNGVKSSYVHCFRYALMVLNTVFILREIFQMIVSPIRYFFLLENILEWSIISLVFIEIINDDDNVYKRGLAALLLLLSWAELVLLLGRLPLFSVYIRMFITVSTNFIMFIGWYAVMLLAFACSFHILFVGEQAFMTLHASLMKILVMLTGELDFDQMPMEDKSPFAQLAFAAFLFLIPIVLMNLLTGLAVSDTQKIRDKAKLYSLLGTVELVSYLEAMLLGDPFSFLANYPPFKWLPTLTPCKTLAKSSPVRNLVGYFSSRILLFRHCLPECRLVVYPNRREKHLKLQCGCSLSFPPSALKEAVRIVAKPDESTDDLRQLKNEVVNLRSSLQNIEACMLSFKNQHSHKV